jgi:inosine-uridine nucleoside N-ribohydrolase
MAGYWIDTDIALGASHGDVDDGWALAVLVREVLARQGKIYGVSVCAGNTDALNAERCVRDLLGAMHITLPQFTSSEAAGAVARVPDDTWILALGPLTNIAAALTIDPHLGGRTRLGIVGGVLDKWRIRRCLSDLNFRRDRNAVNTVLAAFRDVRQYPLDVVDRLTLDGPRMQRVGAASELGAYLAQHSARWLRRARWSHGRAAFPVWDLVAALDACGLLVAATFDVQQRLTGFDVEASWRNAEAALRNM